MTFRSSSLISLAAALAISACASADYSASDSGKAKKVVTKVDTQHGEVFATAEGLTLYTFTKDSNNKSACYGGCAAKWPPFSATDTAKEWGEFKKITREDGSYQWAYKGQPLYTWVGDQKTGDTNGQGLGDVWFVLNTPSKY